MSLRVWLPLTKDLKNQGLDDVTVTNNGATFNSTGKLGGCYYFNNAYAWLPMDYLTFGTEFSVAFWYKIDTAFSGNRHLVCLCNQYGWPQLKFTCAATSNSTLAFNIGDGSTSARSLSTSQIIGSWQHICFTFNNKIAKVYVNGVQTGTATYPINPDWSGTTKMGIGGAPDGHECAITLSLNDVRIYDHCLSPMEIKEISKGLILHYPLNRGGFGQENFILESHKVTSGGQGNGITRTYESDGSIKIVSTSGNGNYASLGFAQNSNTSVGNNMVVGDTYCISCDTKIESGTKLPTLFINSGNGYKQLKPVNGSIIIGKWIRVYYTSTWANPGTNYGNISLHLGFGDAIGTYYFKNFKLEKGSIPTPWCPNSSDALATTMGLNDNIEYDTSGYCNNGTRTGMFSWTSNTPKYNVSQVFNGVDNAIQTPNLTIMITDKNYTIAVWIYKTAIGSKSYQTIYGGPSGFEIEARNGGANETKFVPWNWGKPMASYELNEWNHCVFVHSDSDCKIYLNGEYIATGTAKAANPSGNYFVGAWNTATQQNFDGLMSDFRIYATALSAEDVKDLYELGATIDTNGVLSTYEFTEQ